MLYYSLAERGGLPVSLHCDLPQVLLYHTLSYRTTQDHTNHTKPYHVMYVSYHTMYRTRYHLPFPIPYHAIQCPS